MTPSALREAIRAAALRLGFARAAFARLAEPRTYGRYCAWLAAGYAGEMTYLTDPAPRRSPAVLLPSARTVVCALWSYEPPVDALAGVGLVAACACGRDYHEIMRVRLRDLATTLGQLAARPVAVRVAVDTAPLLERAAAAAAGLGFIGKNTQLITPGLGSYTLLGEVITDLELPPDEEDGSAACASRTRPRCGRCTACIVACPTAALVAPHVLDARRCISYLTIELRGPIPRELRAAIGTRVLGCDACQIACPFNRRARRSVPEPVAPALQSRPSPESRALGELLTLGANGYRRLARGSAWRRLRRVQIQRNAAVALGNSDDPGAVPVLAWALGETSPLVRGHAAWALGRLGGAAPRRALNAAARAEADPFVRDEITAALGSMGAGGDRSGRRER
jgi:epoxyqueuosine reductase